MWKGLYVELYGEFSSRKLQQPASLIFGVSEIRLIKINRQIKGKAKGKRQGAGSFKLSVVKSGVAASGVVGTATTTTTTHNPARSMPYQLVRYTRILGSQSVLWPGECSFPIVNKP